MKFIPNYRVCYGDQFYEAGTPFPIKADDADMMNCLLYTSPSPRDA